MLRAVEDKVIIEVANEPESVSASGLILTKTSEEKTTEGIVSSVGPGMAFADGSRLQIDLKVGDRVTFSKFAGTEIEHEGKNYVILPYREIFAVLG
tara:strand:- start:146 stop:433 length:288 start_codon:yes stop_codon:yes gene_type:complete